MTGSAHISGGAVNNLLAQLSTRDRLAFTRRCEHVTLKFGAVLAEPDARIGYVYFPLSGFISVTVPAERGASLEVGLIGNEGMLGGTIALGVDSAPLHALVQGAGEALRMSATRFRREIDRSSALAVVVRRYCYVLLRQVSQTAACTRFHTIDERLARWLLMTQDRARGAEYHLTQEFLAGMLGVRRSGVSVAAGALQALGLIGYRRGEVVISNRRGLEAASCACYAKDKRLYRRTMGKAA
jgi:CRP-like cAMP-binding protein